MVSQSLLSKRGFLLFFAGALGGFCLLLGCASPSSREKMDAVQSKSNASSAAYTAESFFLDYRSPGDREVENQEFFFKQCELVSRKRFPSRSEYECTGLK